MLQTAPPKYDSALKPAPIGMVREFLSWAEGQPGNFQLIRGLTHMSPSPRQRHSETASELNFLLRFWLKSSGAGRLFTELDVYLDDENYVCPDITYCSHATAKVVLKDDPEGCIKGAPDLAIEILSLSSRGVDLVDKRALYEEKGIKEYWIVDPQTRTFTFLVLEKSAYREVAPVEGCYVASVLPGFSLDLNAFWQGVFPE